HCARGAGSSPCALPKPKLGFGLPAVLKRGKDAGVALLEQVKGGESRARDILVQSSSNRRVTIATVASVCGNSSPSGVAGTAVAARRFSEDMTRAGQAEHLVGAVLYQRSPRVAKHLLQRVFLAES